MAALDFPANPTDGQVYAGYTYDLAKTAWRTTPTTPVITTTSDTPPSNPKDGDIWTDSRDGSTYRRWNDGNSSQWVQLNSSITTKDPNPLPAGSIMAWGSNTIPANWLLCDGSAVSRTTYASLYAAVGTTYGVGDGSSTFNLPNLKGRMPMGKDATVASFNTLANTGGTVGLPVAGGGTASGYGLTYSDSMTTAVSTGASAIPPFVVMNYIIKTSAGETPSDGQLTSRVSAVEGRATSLETRATNLEYNSPNYLINGDFGINQRGFTSVTADSYGFDRWYTQHNTGTITASAQAFTPGTGPAGYEASNFFRMVTTGMSGVNAYALVSQKIEDVRTLAGQTATLSFWARSGSGTPSIAIEFEQGFGTGGSPSAGINAIAVSKLTMSGGTFWTRYSTTVSIPSISGKTIGTTPNTSNLTLNLWLSAGSNYNSRTNSLGIQSNTFDIWGVQIEQGTSATGFRRNATSLQGELAACQRYFTAMNSLSNGNRFYGSGSMYQQTQGVAVVALPVKMRVTPVVTTSAANTFQILTGGSNITLSAIAGANGNQGEEALGIDITIGTTIANTSGFTFRSNGVTTSWIYANAEM